METIDLEKYTHTVASLATDLCLYWTYEERNKIFGTFVIPEIFKTYTVAHIKSVVEQSGRGTWQ